MCVCHACVCVCVCPQEPYWLKLCFAGFREDMGALPQDVRDSKPDMWPGACPPRCVVIHTDTHVHTQTRRQTHVIPRDTVHLRVVKMVGCVYGRVHMCVCVCVCVCVYSM